MAATLTIRDESPRVTMIQESVLEFPAETITVHELIRGRVYQEVADYNLRQRQGSAEHWGGGVSDGGYAIVPVNPNHSEVMGLWLQSGIRSGEARRIARGAGMDYVENRCMMVEHCRLK